MALTAVAVAARHPDKGGVVRDGLRRGAEREMMMMRVEKLCFFPCSGQQMGAVCSILALPLYD